MGRMNWRHLKCVGKARRKRKERGSKKGRWGGKRKWKREGIGFER